MVSRGDHKKREEKFVSKLNEMGRYTYIEGFKNFSSSATVKHNKCGGIITRRASSLLYSAKMNDFCEHCKPEGYGVYAREKKNIRERQLNACDKEAGKIFVVLLEDGILRGKELEDYIKLCTDNLYIANRDTMGNSEIYNAVYNGVIERYKKRGLKYE